MIKQFDKLSVEGVPYATNTLSRSRLSLTALRKKNSCHQVLQNIWLDMFVKLGYS